MIVNKYNNGGGSSTYSESAGTANFAELSNSTKLLEGSSALPQDANTGDVVAVAPTPALLSTRGTKGLRSANTTLGVYQYDGTDWQKIEGGEGSSAYKIELSVVDPQYYTQQDRAALNDFYTAFVADNSIADSAYILVDGFRIYRCAGYTVSEQLSTITFEGSFNNNIVEIWLNFANNIYLFGGLQNAVPTPDYTTLEAVSELPKDANTGDVVALSIPAQEGTWQVFDASEHPTKVRIMTKGDGTYLLHFDSDNLYTGLDYAAGDPPSFDGSGWGLTQDDTYNWHYDDNGFYISVWVEEEKGEWYIYAEMTQGEGGFSMLDAYGLGSESDMYVGATDGSVGVYQYDGSAWNEIGNGGAGGSDFVHLGGLSGTGETGKTYEYNQRIYKWVNGSGKWGRFIKARPNDTDYGQNTQVKSYLLYSILPPVSAETILVNFKCLNTNFYLSYDPSSTFKVYDNNSMTGTPVDIQYNGSEVGFTGSNRTMYISWVEGKVIFRQPDAWVKIENVYADFGISTPHWEAYDVDEFNSVSDINADWGLPMWNSDGKVVGKSYNINRCPIKFNNTGYTNTKYVYGEGWQNFGSWFFPTQAGTAGQVLTSAGNAEPTWQTMIKAVKITSAAYDALVQAGTTDPNTLYLIDDSNA